MIVAGQTAEFSDFDGPKPVGLGPGVQLSNGASGVQVRRAARWRWVLGAGIGEEVVTLTWIKLLLSVLIAVAAVLLKELGWLPAPQ